MYYIEVKGYKKMYSPVLYQHFVLCRGKEEIKGYVIDVDDVCFAISKAIDQFESEFSGYIAVEAKVLYETP